MAEALVVELIAGGVLSIVGHQFDRKDEAIEATKEALTQMAAQMACFRNEMNSQVASLDSHLGRLYETIQTNEYHNIENQMLEELRAEDRSGVRKRVVKVAIALHSLIRYTQCLQVSIEVTTMSTCSSSSAGVKTSSIVETFRTTTANSEFAQKVLNFDELGLFSLISHDTEEPLHINVKAAHKHGPQKEDLILTTGALYTLCQLLCEAIQDPRGVVAIEEDGPNFAHSRAAVQTNACHILLQYTWPSPSEFQQLEDRWKHFLIVETDHTEDGKNGLPLNELRDVLVQKKERMKTKNVYLLGGTGEGKSTLGNAFTGSNQFHVSHAGTGTSKISGSFVREGGVLYGYPGPEIKVWDTPGMDDSESRDAYYQQLLLQHLRRENSVSTIIIVSKDGSRCPQSLQHTISVYKEAFGDVFSSCVCVFIGVNEDNTDARKLNSKRQFWMDRLPGILNVPQESIENRIFFYNAEQTGQETAIEKIREKIRNAKAYLTGAAATIAHGLKKLEEATLVESEREFIREASRQEYDAIRGELLTTARVRISPVFGSDAQVVRLLVELLPSYMSRLQRIFSLATRHPPEEREKMFVFTARSETAKTLLSRHFVRSISESPEAKAKMARTMAQEMNLVLINQGSSQAESSLGRKLLVQKYDLVHIDDQLDTSVFREIDEMLNGMWSDPQYAELFANGNAT